MLDPDDETIIKGCQEGNAILVTWDRVLREAAKGITPYEALDMARETAKFLRRHIAVDRDRAGLVCQLRIEEDYSWRAIARWCSSVWGGPWGASQLAGLVICEKAAKALGQDFMAPPWN